MRHQMAQTAEHRQRKGNAHCRSFALSLDATTALVVVIFHVKLDQLIQQCRRVTNCASFQVNRHSRALDKGIHLTSPLT